MSKKKAFTLVELMVAMAVTIVLFAAVAVAYYFITASNKVALESSAMNVKVRTVREYVLSDDIKGGINENYSIVYNEDTKTLVDEETGREIVSDSAYINVSFSKNEEDFIVCEIEYKETTNRKDLETLTFIVKKSE